MIMDMGTWLPRLLLAALFGGLIGLERQFHGRPAGLRTHMLVSIGAALMTLAGISAAGTDSIANLDYDPGRIAAGIVTGIGFLGAGAIVRTKDMVRGLTTAACLWFVAGAGIACGLGMILECGFSVLLVLVILTVFGLAEEWIPSSAHRDAIITASGVGAGELTARCSEALEGIGIRIQDVEVEVSVGDSAVRLVFHLRTRGRFGRSEAISALSRLEGVASVSWLEQKSET